MIVSEPGPERGSRPLRRRATTLFQRMLTALPAVMLALTAAATMSACSRGETGPAPAEPARPVRTMAVVSAAPDGTWTLAGDVRPRIEVRYGFRVGGRILERRVQVGDRVAPGQVMARLDPKDLTPMLDTQRAQQMAAQTELALAQADLARAEKLRSGSFVSDANVDRQRAAVDAAKARLEAAEAQVRQARNSLDFQSLRADAAGVVVGVDAEAGQVVGVGQTVIRIAQQGDLEVAINIAEQDLARARRTQQWTVELAGLPGQRWEARLRELSPAADPASRTYAVRLTLLGDTRPVAYGMSATVRVAAAGDPEIRVPLTALHSRDGQPHVWLVGPDSKVTARAVTTGRIDDSSVAIASGLNGGEQIVTAGANLLREGQQVRIRPADSASVDAGTVGAGREAAAAGTAGTAGGAASQPGAAR